MAYKVLVCQNKTCKQQGAGLILKAFQRYAQRHDLPETWTEPSGCLGQCGSGPMVLILSKETFLEGDRTAEGSPVETSQLVKNHTGQNHIWHSGVRPEDVWLLAEQYSPKATAVSENSWTNANAAGDGPSKWLWISLAGLGVFFIVCIAVAVFAGRHSHYV